MHVFAPEKPPTSAARSASEDGDGLSVFGRDIYEPAVRADGDADRTEFIPRGSVRDGLHERELARARIATKAGDGTGAGSGGIDVQAVGGDAAVVTPLEAVQPAPAVAQLLNE